jgi:ribosomal protein L18
MTPLRAPRYRVCVYELRDDKTTQVIDAYGSGFITAVATLDAEAGLARSTLHAARCTLHAARCTGDFPHANAS